MNPIVQTLSNLDVNSRGGCSSDSNRQPVAHISNITLIPPNTKSKNDRIATTFTSNFLKSSPLPLFTPVCNFEALFGASLDINESASTA